MKPRIRLKDIAREANVHVSTVSLALRNDPRILPGTREKIKNLARDMGYTPDAMMSALAAYRKTRRSAHGQGELAYLTDFPAITKRTSNNVFFHCAKARAIELGYSLEEFPLETSDFSAKRLRSIWRQRNIRGILIGPWLNPGAKFEIDWNDFAVVAFGHSTCLPGVNRTGADQFQNMLHHLGCLRAMGYRRIGFHLLESVDIRSGGKYHAAYRYDQEKHPLKKQPGLLTHPKPSAGIFRQWIEKNQLDCVITHIEYRAVIESSGFRIPGDIGFSLISRSSLNPVDLPEVSGFDERPDLLAAGAVDFLVSLIHQNNWGLSDNPKNYMILGEYYRAKTTRSSGRAKSPQIEPVRL